MNYEAKKAELESKIKELQSELETLEKQSKKEDWKNSLVEKFKVFLDSMDDETANVEFRALRDDNAFILNLASYSFNEFTENKPAEKPENKIVVASIPKANEPTEPKPVKMKMSLDELIKGME